MENIMRPVFVGRGVFLSFPALKTPADCAILYFI